MLSPNQWSNPLESTENRCTWSWMPPSTSAESGWPAMATIGSLARMPATSSRSALMMASIGRASGRLWVVAAISKYLAASSQMRAHVRER